MAQVPYSDEVKAAAIETYRLEGSTAAAKKHGMNKATITKWAKKAGVATVATSRTREATNARAESLRERRVAFSNRAMDQMEKDVERLSLPYVVYSFGGASNTYNAEVMQRPPARDYSDLVRGLTGLTAIVDKTLDKEPDTATEAAVSMLSELQEALGMLPFDGEEVFELEQDDTTGDSGSDTEDSLQ